jgi:hypothetical protein
MQKKIQSTSKNHLGLELNVPVYCMTTIGTFVKKGTVLATITDPFGKFEHM